MPFYIEIEFVRGNVMKKAVDVDFSIFGDDM